MITFFYLDAPEAPLTFATRDELAAWAFREGRLALSPRTAEFAWLDIEAHNAAGVHPWVYLCPYAADIGGVTNISVCDTQAKADASRYEAGMDI